jgi:hypothetical protein
MTSGPTTAVRADPLPTCPEPLGLEHRNRFYFLALPFLISIGVWFLTFVFGGWGFALEILAAVGISFTLVGPTVIFTKAFLGPGVAAHADTFHVAAAVAYTSVLLAFVFSYNLDLFERIPRAGDWFRRVRLGMQEMLREHRWIRRLAVLGVGIFVLLPLPGSGSLGGSVVGRLLGLGPFRTFVATGTAGICVAALYGYSGKALEDALLGVPLPLRVAGAVVMLVLLGFLVRFLNSMARRTPAAEPPPPK